LQEAFFQKLMYFSKGKKALEASDSNTHGFLSKDIYVSSNQLNMPIWSKESQSPP
jgi:hypothetical protein